MPRQPVELDYELEHLGILDEAGNVDSELDPGLEDPQLTRMHEAMLLSRRFDERMLSMQRQGRLGTFALLKGQEAAQIGSVATIEDSDWMVPSYRETAVSLWRGTPLEGLLLFNAGYNEGGRIPDAQNDLPISIPVASQLLHAAGLAYGLKVQGKQAVVMTYFGDGATSQGDFHEALNFASVFECPVVFVCQNNQYAISVPRSHQTKSKTLAQKGIAYGVPGVQVDGNDLLAVYSACRDAVKLARERGKPTLVECVTYRLSMHTTVDDPTKYRDDDEVERWERREPLIRLQKYMKGRGLLDDDRLKQLEDSIKERIDQAVAKAGQSMQELDDPSVMFDHLCAEVPPSLAEQRAEFEWRRREHSPNGAASDAGNTGSQGASSNADDAKERNDDSGESRDENEQEVKDARADHGAGAESGAA